MTEELKGTMECPLCVKDWPHEHSGLEVHSFRQGLTRPDYTCKQCGGHGTSGFGICGHCDGDGECCSHCCTTVKILTTLS